MFYEINLLISPILDEKATISFVEALEKDLQNYGRIETVASPKRIKLAYPILNQNDAWLYFFNLYIENEEIDKKEVLDTIKSKIKESGNVLRSLFIKKETKSKKEKKNRTPKKSEDADEKREDMEKINEKLEEILGE